MQALKELGGILFALCVAGFAVVQGYLGLTSDRVPILPARAMREASGVFVYWSEHPVWSAIAVACWFVLAALVILVAIKLGFSDDTSKR
ncbi:MAG TPA: hypothetical protein VN675_07000 [Burkholderiales bacterium]|nr:hypothetical protein [Burkholderiales bacterium]